MRSRDFMKGLSMIHPKYIHEAEFEILAEEKPARRRSGRMLVLIAAACMLLGLAITAYAANLFGIRELFRTPSRELPEAADPYIQPETVTGDARGWSCEITESLADQATVMATVVIHGGDRYIIAPTYVGPNDSVWEIGIEGNQTLREYAAKQGKTLLFVGASIKRVGNMEGINGSQRMQNVSDNEMIILTQTEQTVDTSNPNALCVVYALADGEDDVERIELPFTLNTAPSLSDEMIFHPEQAEAIPGLTVGDLIVTETALGYNLSILETVTNDEQWYNIMKIDIDGLSFGKGGGSVLRDDGNWYFEANMCQGTVGDTLTVHYYDWNKEPIGVIVFHLS